MDCCCKRGETRELIIEADIGADPIWCKHCRCNLDIEDLPISQGLMDQLESWSAQYGKWIDWEKEQLLPHAAQQEFAYNEGGYTELLAIRKAQQALQTNDLSSYTMYASGEPCPMCLTAMYFAGISKIYYCASVEEAVEVGLAYVGLYQELSDVTR